jgi:hypothetical protein
MVDSAIVASGPYPKGASQAHGLGAAAKEIAFIDPAVSDVHGRLGPDLDPTPLNRAEPAPRQMANALAGRQSLDAIHIIAHGASGALPSAGTLVLMTTAAAFDEAE